MKNRIFWVMSALLVAGGAVSHLLHNAPITLHESKKPIAQTFFVNEQSEMPINEICSSGISESTVVKAVQSENEYISPMFQFDEHDNLVLNESTRLNIEKLYLLNTPEELDSKLQKLSTALPATTYRQLVHLMDYFDKYMMASKQIYPPDIEPANIEDALDQLDGLHSLRLTHFGFDVATAFFAEEEKLNRQLLDVNARGGRWDDENVGM